MINELLSLYLVPTIIIVIKFRNGTCQSDMRRFFREKIRTAGLAWSPMTGEVQKFVYDCTQKMVRPKTLDISEYFFVSGFDFGDCSFEIIWSQFRKNTSHRRDFSGNAPSPVTWELPREIWVSHTVHRFLNGGHSEKVTVELKIFSACGMYLLNRFGGASYVMGSRNLVVPSTSIRQHRRLRFLPSGKL